MSGDEALAANARLKHLLKDLEDGLKELLCKILDSAELVQQLHALTQEDQGVVAVVDMDSAHFCVLRLCSRSGVGRLTPRERQIAVFLGKRYSNKDIARALKLTPQTVGTHARRIFDKLGIHSRHALEDIRHLLVESD